MQGDQLTVLASRDVYLTDRGFDMEGMLYCYGAELRSVAEGRSDYGFTCHPGEDGRIGIAVADTGPGIPADKLPRLFTQFDRLGAEHSDVQGTGIGLVLAKRLAEAMGGALTVDSVEGQGTIFTIELALAMEPA